MDDHEIERHYLGAGGDLRQLERELEDEGISPLIIILAKGRDGMIRGSWPAEFHFRQSTITEGITARPDTSASPFLIGTRQGRDSAGRGHTPAQVEADMDLGD